MATVTTTNPASIANTLQRYYSRKLLSTIEKQLVLAQFGQKQTLPRKLGDAKIRFFRFGEPSTTGIQDLTEGTPISESAYRELSVEYVDVDLTQVGQVVALTDVLQAVEILNFLDEATEINGKDLALYLDTTIRNELAKHTGTSGGVDYSQKNFVYGGTKTSYSGVYNSGSYTSDAVITSTNLADAATALKIQNCPRVGGYYIGVVAPQVARDLMVYDDVWLRVSEYQDKENIYRGEVGRMLGIRILETTNPFRSNTQGTYNENGVVFSSFVFGNETYGTVSMQGQSPYAPRMYILNTADKTDPLNQKTLIGFKAWFAAKLLQPKWLVEIYSQTGYGNT